MTARTEWRRRGSIRSLARVIGGFADDPLWDEFIQEMEQSRREMDRKHGLVE